MRSSESEMPKSNPKSATSESLHESCRELGNAVKQGDIGDTVTAIQHLILRYYEDVRGQADESFKSAKRVALFGFLLLALTVVYVMAMDLMPHISTAFRPQSRGLGVGTIGLVGSGLIEFVAGLQFVLYGRATRQFGAFHICLERTHRYLLAYEMTQKISGGKDQTLEKIVCIMANAPMITGEDIEGATSDKIAQPRTK